jgi:anti-sigma factor RsiW
MTHDELRSRMADYLDELLDEEEAQAVEAEIAAHPALLAEVARMRAVLYRPYPVAPPSEDQPARIVARRGAGMLPRVVRYAAVFAAGALVALMIRRESAHDRPVGIDGPQGPEIPVVPAKLENLRVR